MNLLGLKGKGRKGNGVCYLLFRLLLVFVAVGMIDVIRVIVEDGLATLTINFEHSLEQIIRRIEGLDFHDGIGRRCWVVDPFGLHACLNQRILNLIAVERVILVRIREPASILFLVKPKQVMEPLDDVDKLLLGEILGLLEWANHEGFATLQAVAGFPLIAEALRELAATGRTGV